MKGFPGIFLKVGSCDPDGFGPRIGCDLKAASAHDRNFILADLVAFGQIRIEIVFSGENGNGIDGCPDREAKSGRHQCRLAIHHGEYPGQTDIHGTGLGVGRRAIGGRGPREDLALSHQLCVNLKPDDALEFHAQYSAGMR